MELDYERDVGIDEQALDIEWLQQASLMYRYAKHQAQTRKAMDEAKERLDYVRASLEMDIRANPDKYGLSKVTEAAIASTILLQGGYQGASKAYINAKYENEIAGATVRAIDQKKTALENMVRLLAASYFAGPQAPRDLRVEWGEYIKKQGNRDANTKVVIKDPRNKEESEPLTKGRTRRSK